MSVTYQRERVQDCFTEAKPLLEAHWAEVPDYPIDLDPDWELYSALEDLGFLRTFTMRDTGNLYGYAIFAVRTALHHRGLKQATQDIFYITPALRLYGGRFILWCDRQLHNEGVGVINRAVKVSNDFGPLLERVGYRHVEHVWSRWLGEADHGN